MNDDDNKKQTPDSLQAIGKRLDDIADDLRLLAEQMRNDELPPLTIVGDDQRRRGLNR